MLHTKIPLNPYPYDCLLFIGDDEETFKSLEDLGLSREETTFYDGKTGYSKSQDIILWLRKPSIEFLVHEAVHVSTFLFTSVGVPISFENDETLAYTVQYLIKESLLKFGQYFNLSDFNVIDELRKSKELLETNGWDVIYNEEKGDRYKTLERQAAKDIKDGHQHVYNEEGKIIGVKVFSEKEKKNTMSCSVDPAIGYRTITVSTPTVPEDKEKIEVIREFCKNTEPVPFPQLIEEMNKYYEEANLIEHENYTPHKPINSIITNKEFFPEEIVDYDEYLNVVNLLNSHINSSNLSENDEFLNKHANVGKLQSDTLEENQKLKEELKSRNWISINLHEITIDEVKNAHKSVIGKLNIENEKLKERLEEVRKYNVKINGLYDEFKQENEELKSARDVLRERIKVLEEELTQANEYRDTREESIDRARQGLPPINDLSLFSEQAVIIYCNRFYEVNDRLPHITSIDRVFLSEIQDFITVKVTDDVNNRVMLGLSINHGDISHRLKVLTKVDIPVRIEHVNKLRGVETREGGC